MLQNIIFKLDNTNEKELKKKKKKLCDKIENDNQTDFRNSPTAFIKQ